ncbi:MAG: tetratricopeptide repeat protein [Sphingobacteriales bacterium]|jgi:hypothetical protein|nr:tetratricopeptide repeat protein [Sphingobacteriales bacterium]MBP9142275.1 tetratricopeptide repeat protein [Chitinophagales bacterium]MDA0199800.1 tetratricopeptide repeat protein [Bacteroidota bacterium]MBK6889642.1 tetratricopeptide repeat protein [Sphingobacteriales bacterium]MBK7527845.1 tetratricopeptide repeat protein [Sphingobacteriales bacterium]
MSVQAVCKILIRPFFTTLCLHFLFFVANGKLTLLNAQTNLPPPDSLLLQGVAAAKEHQYNLAISTLKLCTKAYPSKAANCAYELAYTYYQLKNYKKAIKILKSLTATNKTAQAEHFYLLSNIYWDTEQQKKATDLLENALEIYPDNGQFYDLRGGYAYYSGNNDEAVRWWEKGIANAPTYADNYYWAAQLYCRSSEKYKGLIYAEMYMLLQPGHAQTPAISSLMGQTILNAFNANAATNNNKINPIFSQSAALNSILNFDDADDSEEDSAALLADETNQFTAPLKTTYQQLAKPIADSLKLKLIPDQPLELPQIVAWRVAHTQAMLKQAANFAPSVWLQFNQKIENLQLNTAYQYWLLGGFDKNAFKTWYNSEPQNAEVWKQLKTVISEFNNQNSIATLPYVQF